MPRTRERVAIAECFDFGDSLDERAPRETRPGADDTRLLLSMSRFAAITSETFGKLPDQKQTHG
jgi:hypothetical protein